MRSFKGIICDDISEFESYMPSHAVRSLWGGSQPLQHAGWPMRSRAIAWNGFAERLIGSIRRECVDHLVVLGEAHLRWILTKYATYYNELRTHRSLNKDAPIRRAIQQWAASYLHPSSAAFITTIAESSFQYTQGCTAGWRDRELGRFRRIYLLHGQAAF